MADSQDIYDKYPSLKKIMEDDDYKEWNDGREQTLLQYIKQRPDFASSLKGNPTKILEAMDHFATQQDFLINIGSDKARIVADIIAQEKPKTLVELGGYVGYSAIWFADKMRQVSPDASSSPKLWSLEFDPIFADIARELIDIAGLTEVVTVVTGAAGDSIREMKSDGRLEHIDLLFIDHGEGGIELYEQDFKICMQLGLLKSGACIVADNVLRPGAPEYRKYIRSQPGLKSRGIKGLIMPGEFEDELEVTKVL